jgi:hypothetical protein
VFPGETGEGVAWYSIREGRIYVNASVVFPEGEPAKIGDLTDRMELSKYPVAGGVVMHEAMHARFSTAHWTAEFVSRLGPAWDTFEMLEETRVEFWGHALNPRDRGYLRTSARAIIMNGSDEYTGSPRFACQLILGRWWVGVFEEKDVVRVQDWLIANGWSPSVLDRAREIILEFAKLSDTGADLDRQVALAWELHNLMPADPPGALGLGGEPGQESPGSLGDLLSAILDALERSERGGLSEVFEVAQEIKEELDAQTQREERETKEQNEKKAEQVFGSRLGRPAELQKSRAPTASERHAAVLLARELDQARYRDRELDEYLSDIPPGRLHGGEAMRRDAAIWAGASPTPFRPFKRRRWLETEEPTLTVGIMTDTSGSMKRVQPGIGSAVWIISDAVYRVAEATAAQVYFGKNVVPGLRSGERLSEVRVWDGMGAYEDFDGGFRALDGELNLLQGEGARLLFVISDGEFKTGPGIDQVKATARWIQACEKAGVAVVWLQLRGQNTSIIRGMEVVDVDPDDISSASRIIGQACVRTLASASGL